MTRLLALIVMCAFLAPAWAAPASVTLSVPSMNCPVCPLTVKLALTAVSGVRGAVVDFDRRLATVSFDDSKTSVDALTRATENAGYPSSPVAMPKK